MFDRTLKGNWVVWHRNPTNNVEYKSVRMKKRAALDRMEMFRDAFAVEKVAGIFQRKILKKSANGHPASHKRL